MTQNIYDDAAFFTAYARLERSIEGLEGAVEWPALHTLLPDLKEHRVLDLGCGYGWFCRWARTEGASSVQGIDVSERMLERAASMTDDTAITYTRADLEQVELPPASFDLAYSSLAFHYLTKLDRLLVQIYRSLVPGGHLIFSVEHPIYTAPSHPGWSLSPTGQQVWPVDRYLEEGPRTTDWLAPGVIKQHRTLITYVNLLLQTGFHLRHLEEWGPSDAQIAASPLLAQERDRPPFLLISAVRPEEATHVAE